VGTWAEDPELLATFRAEVDERLASLSAGLLQLETQASPRQLIAALFRDAHTVKGSARMLGLDEVVDVAHRAEDVLGALRDGRRQATKDLIDLLLVAAEVISRSLPGAERPVPPDEIIARRLKWRPAAVRITTEPEVARGTRIVVRDPNRGGAGTLARAGEEVDVPFYAADEGSKEIEIAIDSGEVFTSERLTVRAGQHLAHVVKLKTSN